MNPMIALSYRAEIDDMMIDWASPSARAHDHELYYPLPRGTCVRVPPARAPHTSPVASVSRL